MPLPKNYITASGLTTNILYYIYIRYEYLLRPINKYNCVYFYFTIQGPVRHLFHNNFLSSVSHHRLAKCPNNYIDKNVRYTPTPPLYYHMCLILVKGAFFCFLQYGSEKTRITRSLVLDP